MLLGGFQFHYDHIAAYTTPYVIHCHRRPVASRLARAFVARDEGKPGKIKQLCCVFCVLLSEATARAKLAALVE